jgi:hypothetical protein
MPLSTKIRSYVKQGIHVIIINRLTLVKKNSSTHLRVLLVLTDRDIWYVS